MRISELAAVRVDGVERRPDFWSLTTHETGARGPYRAIINNTILQLDFMTQIEQAPCLPYMASLPDAT